ncbi:MarR family winged helix-turn-helix transcriptional regulator [Marimonas sp. MJW-29]|uniref:MarR family winged helix-turn-helix transcriptional regulator n=1 Tax=Sulfitobacter sediminis TaxID=3234186 RepID=A0ABV3RUP7_9RHOB
MRVTRSTENKLREYLRIQHDTTLPRFDVMAALFREGGPLKMSELSKMLLVSNGNASTIVNRLEKDGLVTRTPMPTDRRVVMVDLTELGRTQFETQAKCHEAMINDIFSGLGHEDLDLIRDLLRRAEAAQRVE